MATRSTIAILRANGSVRSVYCHWDGNLNGVGRTLLEHYPHEHQVEKLLHGGDMSSLGKDIDATQYYADRGEETPPKEHPDVAAYKSSIDTVWHEYNYLWDGEWFVSEDGVDFKALKKLVKKA